MSSSIFIHCRRSCAQPPSSHYWAAASPSPLISAHNTGSSNGSAERGRQRGGECSRLGLAPGHPFAFLCDQGGD
jgi:hypothetical protein